MASDLQSANEPSLASLVNGIISDAQDLIKQQVQLLRSEVRDDLKKTQEAAVPMIIGGIFSFVGLVFVGLTVVYLLYWSLNPPLTAGSLASEKFPLWGCYAIVAGVIVALGVGLTAYGVVKFNSFNPLPDETAKGVEETLEWKTNPH